MQLQRTAQYVFAKYERMMTNVVSSLLPLTQTFDFIKYQTNRKCFQGEAKGTNINQIKMSYTIRSICQIRDMKDQYEKHLTPFWFISTLKTKFYCASLYEVSFRC